MTQAPSPLVSTAAPVIEVRDVRKTYGEKVAVDDVTFAMPPDAILGLLGPNGAGKTSLIRMITTITAPDSGQIFFQGAPLSGYPPHPDRLPARGAGIVQADVRPASNFFTWPG